MNTQEFKAKLQTADVHRSSMAYKLCLSILEGHVFLRPCYRQGFSIRDYSLQTIGLLKFIGVDFHIGNDGERLGSVNQYIRITDKELIAELETTTPEIVNQIMDSMKQREQLREAFDTVKPRLNESWTQTRDRVLTTLSNPIVYKENADVLQIVVNHIYKLKSKSK